MCCSTASTTREPVVVGNLDHRRGRRRGGRQLEQPIDLLDRSPHRDGGGGPAIGDAFGQGADVLLDHRRVGGVTGEQALEPLGRVDRLILRGLGRPDLRSAHMVEGELVLLLRQRFELVLGDEDQQVAGDDLLGRPGHRSRIGLASSRTRAVRGLFGGSSIGSEVGPAIVEAFVSRGPSPRAGRVPARRPRSGRQGR